MGEENLNFKIREIEYLLSAINVSIQKGGNFLLNRRAPYGPIMRERNLDYIHKATWGMYASGVDHDIIAQLIDWAIDNALQPNGDIYFHSEGPEYRVLQRLYRPLNFGKVAAWIGHPMMKNELILNRILQYQHTSGGVFHYIGDDPEKVEVQPTIGSLNTTFFGHLMIALDIRDRAIMAGDWVHEWVLANRKNMLQDGILYTNMTPDGRLVKEFKPGTKITSVVDYKDAKQEFWHPGTAMAYLSVLYEKMVQDWGYNDERVQRYLDSALLLLEFEKYMPLHTYLWPSKCKVGWGAGELLRIMVKFKKGTAEQIETAYTVAKKVAIHTFIDNQLPNGGWSCMHYPLSELAPEIKFDYKPLNGLVNVPDQRIEGSQTIFLPGEEITGEFLGEMRSIKLGLEELLKHYRNIGSKA